MRNNHGTILPRHQQDVTAIGVESHVTLPSNENEMRHIFEEGVLPEENGDSQGSSDSTNSKNSGQNVKDSSGAKEMYWCVDKPWAEPNETLMCPIQVDCIKDDMELYQKLKNKYVRIRGPLIHNVLSWKTCTGVKFVKVRSPFFYMLKTTSKTTSQFYRVRENNTQVMPTAEQSPPPDAGYEFAIPRPEDTHRKIAAVQIVAGLKHPRNGCGESVILPMVPKKSSPPLDKKMGAEGWGLYATKGFSLAKIMMWVITVQILGFAFVCLWLTLVNKTDLQNAFLPVMFLTTLVIGGFSVLQPLTAA
jgi:hypothetical protein